MTLQLQPLLPSAHRAHGWQRHDHYRFTSGDSWAPLNHFELSAALQFYPLTFVKRPGGGFWLAALLGLHAGSNYCLSAAGKWLIPYVPAIYRGYPFALAKLPGVGEGDSVLCFDHASGMYREAPEPALGEERFFDDDGQPMPFVQKLIEFLWMSAASRELTNRAVDALEAAGVLEPWAMPQDNPEPAGPLLQGLYRISEAALNALTAESLKVLQQAHALPIAYAQMLSMPRLVLLRRLYAQQRTSTTQPAIPASIDALFGEAPDETLKFDWSKL